MIKILFISLLFIPKSFYGQAKECNCLTELNDVSQLIENAKSYKTQIKRKSRETEFKNFKNKIEQEILKDTLSKYFCIGYLQKYISFIKDKHNQVYVVPENIHLAIPDYSKPIDTSLKNVDEVSGIYYAGMDKILVQRENDSTWFGIMVDSESKEWTNRKIRLRIDRLSDGNFELFEFYPNGLLFYQKNIKISDGRIHSTYWNKQNSYFFNMNHKNNFNYKSISATFDYIGIKTLKRTNKLMKEADDFYETYLDILNKENIIIDLRNNSGGSINQANALLKAIRRNNAIKKIYVLINFKTASAAELMTLKLREDERTIILGENSKGMVSYGYGNKSLSTKTDCGEFEVVLSTKQEHGKLEKYEYVGIIPDVRLNNDSDWVEQIIKLSEK